MEEKKLELDYRPDEAPAEEKKPEPVPVLKLISDALQDDGSLPEDFSLGDAIEAAASGKEEGSRALPVEEIGEPPADDMPVGGAAEDQNDEPVIRWADGAEDGVLMYHTNRQPMSEEEQSLMADAVWALSTGEYSKADELFLQLAGTYPVIFFAEPLQDYLLDNKDTISNEAVFRYAVRSTMKSPDKEIVKIGLTMLQLFDIKDDATLRDMVRTLSVCSEFTLYGLQCMLNWIDPNGELFALAKKVRGWGRVHVMRFLKPGGREIKRWALKEGVNNGVLPAYTALPAWELSEADKLLDGALTTEEFGYIRDIIDALLDEGPVYGISRIKEPEAAIRRFLNHAQNFRLGPDDYRIIDQIEKRWEKDPLIPAMCRGLKENM